MASDRKRASEIFRKARAYMMDAGLASEIQWQRDVSIELFSETDLLRESAWVVLCSGFRESVVRRMFGYFSLCFCDWESAAAIVNSANACKISAGAVFRNQSKVEAIAGIAEHVMKGGFTQLKKSVVADPIGELQKLPYIGPITVWHLAKNLGMNTAKPDRHLARVSMSLGFENAFDFCNEIAGAFGEEPKVVDLIVWRFFADNPSELRYWI